MDPKLFAQLVGPCSGADARMQLGSGKANNAHGRCLACVRVVVRMVVDGRGRLVGVVIR